MRLKFEDVKRFLEEEWNTLLNNQREYFGKYPEGKGIDTIFERLHDGLYYTYLEDKFSDNKIQDKYISHCPNFFVYFEELCFCDKMEYKPSKNVFHFTLFPCDKTNVAYCVSLNGLELIIKKHKKGKCPYTEYKIIEEE